MNCNHAKMSVNPVIAVLLLPLLLLTYESSDHDRKYITGLNTGQSHVEQDSLTDHIQTLPGFEVQLLYKVPREDQGSWVSLTVGPEGNLIASDQGDKGLFRVIVGGGPEDPEVKTEKIILPASGAQGLKWAFGNLYTNINGQGLFRLRDTKGNGHFNILEYLGGPLEPGEHGNHSVILTEDGQGLYIVNGNHTPPPNSATSRLSNWQEDILLPRNWDARGHARGIFAPGGYIARINPEATQWDIISIGYRNTYDIAINQHGELFAYDSDMEWDMGMPWYRPTRLLHAVSGSDYGWRSGSGKWKEYYEDSLPPLLNIGPGSPTGLVFGTGAAFPARYQRALFALDWTFGTIRAIHLKPEGASYRAEAEEFLSGSPLPLTDAVIGKDGALYFITGGRNKQSYLYRVVYRGQESTAPVGPVDNPEARAARELRHKLESFHGHQDSEAVEFAWPHLADEDRFLRHAARVAIESQPVETWAAKALTELDPQARITAMVALARTGSKKYRSDAIKSLLQLNVHALSTEQKLGYLRAMSLIFMRLGDPDRQEREKITNTLQQLLPDDDASVNTELIRVLVYLKDSRVIKKALALIQRDTEPPVPDWDSTLIARNKRYGGTINDMIENPPPTTKLEYAFMLRNLRNGWTIEQRREYFTFINEAADGMGGASYTGFLERMRSEALSNASEEEVAAVADLTGVSLTQEPDFEISPPKGPARKWTLEEAVEVVNGHLNNRDFLNGRNAFFASGCASCHRFDGFGGNIGPDLSTVGLRFSVEGLLEDIIEPSSLISDQYSSSEVKLKNGDTISGLVVEYSDHLKIYTRNPEEPPAEVPLDQVLSTEPVEVSQMPPGLVNPLNPNELRDLIAYIKSGGDPENEMFKRDSVQTASNNINRSE